MGNVEIGGMLAMEFLKRCQKRKVSGVALLNALGTALVGFFCSHSFENDADRLKELNKFTAYLRSEVEAAIKFSIPPKE